MTELNPLPAASLRITLLGNFGSGNLGNECTLGSVVDALRTRLPSVSLRSACANPEDVTQRHGIPACRFQRPATAGRPVVVHRLFQEIATYLIGLHVLWNSDVLVVCGTNLLSDYLTGPKGWPYGVFKWTTLGRICGVKIVFLGVGVGPIEHRVSRWLIGRSLRLAAYRSYRDRTSRCWARTVGAPTQRDALCPDVVFGLPEPIRDPADAGGEKPLIGVGLKNYPEIEGPGRERHLRYVGEMATFIAGLLRDGYRVRLLIGDFEHDRPVMDHVTAAVRHLCPEGRIAAELPRTVPELLKQIAETQAVISPRFHNLVLALLHNKPVISLSDHHKLDEVMAHFGLGQYTLALDGLSADDLRDRFDRLQSEAPRLRQQIRARVSVCRGMVDEQYDAALNACGIGCSDSEPISIGPARECPPS